MIQPKRDRTSGTSLSPCSGSDAVVKIIDFGLAAFCRQGHMLSTVCGSKPYIAPEVMRGNYNLAADVWSAGVIFHTLLVGQVPREGDCFSGLDGLSPNLASLIQDLLLVDYSQRPTAKVIVQRLLDIRESRNSIGNPV